MQEQIDMLQERNQRLESALRQLKVKYDECHRRDEIVSLSADEITALFERIKNSPYSNETKRYLRSVMMLIKNSGDASLYAFLINQLQTD